MSDAYQVERRGTDSSGRAVYANKRMWAAWDELVRKLGATPTITQGAYMVRNGGGAAASAGYHDQGGPFDVRVWDLGSKGLTVSKVVRVAREIGWAAWLRDPQHGGFSDPHIHMTLLGDEDATPGIRDQENQYRRGFDGLSWGSDYHWRPDPIPTFRYDGDDMAEADVKAINKHTDDAVGGLQKRLLDRINQIAKAERERDAAKQKQLLGAIATLPVEGGSVSLDAVTQAVRAVFADAGQE